ncbi:3,4-dihydroxy-2-butanone-4-phosphate synthase [Amycolatopsis sp. NPDC098790]|uniref:3,4-dihydroxy-2-butanone-4-phosphate synthase n=1 Tax=Amycolatopsis sp. NPDC098790 TaxID=3363939 RepID=UPI003802CD32
MADTVQDALDALKRGEFVVVLDAADRENEADLVLAAADMTPEKMAFLLRHTTGIVCVPMPAARADALGLPLMVADNTDRHRTAFTITVDALGGTTTGVSAADRTATARLLADPDARPEDFARPGHMFPLRAHGEGVLARPGHTEAAVDLAGLAGLDPVMVISELTRPDGEMMRGPEVLAFARDHGLPVIGIADVIAAREVSAEQGGLVATGSGGVPAIRLPAASGGLAAGVTGAGGYVVPGEVLAVHGGLAAQPVSTGGGGHLVPGAVSSPAALGELVGDGSGGLVPGEVPAVPLPTAHGEPVGDGSGGLVPGEVPAIPLPTAHGDFTARLIRTEPDGGEHLVLTLGDLTGNEPVLVRVHSECATGDLFGSLRCDCGEQLHDGLAAIAAAGRGVLVYERGHEGRGIGLADKFRAYALQDRGADTVDANLRLGHPADARDFGPAARVLLRLGLTTVTLLTNNPDKVHALRNAGLHVTTQPLRTVPARENVRYLRTKQARMGHDLALEDGLAPAADGTRPW